MRPTRNEVLMEHAVLVARRGTCSRKQVGAVIAREGRIITVGYNGAPPGLQHCDENLHGWHGQWLEWVDDCCNDGMAVSEAEDRADTMVEVAIIQSGCRNATHAEANALAFAAKYGVSTEGAELFVTVSPCENCARLLIAAGIVAITYRETYRDSSGVNLLYSADVLVTYSP